MHSSRHAGKRIVSLVLLIVPLIVPLIATTFITAVPLVTVHAAIDPPVEQGKVVLGDTSSDGPGLWTSNPGAPSLDLASVLAWVGTNAGRSLNVMQSGDGVHYGGKITFPESSATRPAVAAQGAPTTIVLAWTGLDANHSLNLLCHGPACGTSQFGGSYRKLTLRDSSFTSPALARFGNHYLLGWAGTDVNHSLNILPFSLTTGDSGFQLGAKTTLRQFSSSTQPSLVGNPQNNQLLLSWAATTPASQLSFATSGDGVGWSSAQTIGDTSAVGPASFSVSDTRMPTYWVAWTGSDAAHHLNVRFTQDVSQWPPANKTTLGELALGAPGLGYIGDVGHMLLAWTGTDAAHHMNIATLVTSTTPTLDQRIDSFIAGLSTTQLIGQTLMMSVCTSSFNADLNQALTQWDVGSAIIYTSCNGGPTQPPTAAGLQQLNQDLQSHANHSGSLILAVDQEGGSVDRLAPYFGATPSARQLANTGNPQNAYNQAQTDAGNMRAVGLNQDFAPVVDVDQGGGAGSSRMFGTTVGTVTTYGGAFLAGLQQNGVSGSLKHWPGIGASTGNPDFVLPTINSSQATLNAVDFSAFAGLLYQNPGMIMVTTVFVPAFDTHAPADFSSTLVNGVLRGQLGYQGVVVTDALGANSVVIYMQQQGFSNATQGIAEASVRAFLAGDDLLLCPLSQPDLQAIVGAMTQAVQSGRISQSRLQASVHRIIRLKVEMGLLTVP